MFLYGGEEKGLIEYARAPKEDMHILWHIYCMYGDKHRAAHKLIPMSEMFLRKTHRSTGILLIRQCLRKNAKYVMSFLITQSA